MKEPEVLWAPHPGPQTEFVNSGEFEVLFGGAKGPGKSDALLMASVRQTDKARYKALILRETFVQTRELIDRSHRLFPKLSTRPGWNGETNRWTFPSGAIIAFGGVERAEDVERFMGQEWGYIGFDELGNVPDERVWELLMAENRSPDPSIVRMMRATANPGKAGHGWVKRRWVEPCGRDGRTVYVERVKLPSGKYAVLTRRYIPARITDNPVYAEDPIYMAQLASLPEVLREQLLFGNWDAGAGAALGELDDQIHIVQPFEVPDYWLRFGSFDWGYAHPFAFCHFAVDEDGRLWVVDTIWGRGLLPHEIVERITSKVEVYHHNYLYTVAGHDVRSKMKARGENTPSIQEEFQDYGIILGLANIDRKMGLNNLRHFFAWRGLRPDGGDGDPYIRLMDTPGNRKLWDQLLAMVTDPDDPEDVLKMNADPVTGRGGDDGYDALRYGVASRPARPLSTWHMGQTQSFSKEALYAEVEKKYRDDPSPERDEYVSLPGL